MSQASEGLQATEAECAEGRTAPRVSLPQIEAFIDGVSYVSGTDLCPDSFGLTTDQRFMLGTLTVCLVVTKNNWAVIGKAAPISVENFNAALGRKLAYEDCIRQLWPLMGFAAKEKLVQSKALGDEA